MTGINFIMSICVNWIVVDNDDLCIIDRRIVNSVVFTSKTAIVILVSAWYALTIGNSNRETPHRIPLTPAKQNYISDSLTPIKSIAFIFKW